MRILTVIVVLTFVVAVDYLFELLQQPLDLDPVLLRVQHYGSLATGSSMPSHVFEPTLQRDFAPLKP